MAANGGDVGDARHLGGLHIAHGADAEHLRTHQAQIDRHVHERDREHYGLNALAERRHQRDSEDEHWKGLQNVRGPHHREGEPHLRAAPNRVKADEGANRRTDDCGEQRAEDRNGEVDSRRRDRSAENIHADRVRAEQMGAAGRLEEFIGIGFDRRIRRYGGREQRRQHHDRDDPISDREARPDKESTSKETQSGHHAKNCDTDIVAEDPQPRSPNSLATRAIVSVSFRRSRGLGRTIVVSPDDGPATPGPIDHPRLKSWKRRLFEV